MGNSSGPGFLSYMFMNLANKWFGTGMTAAEMQAHDLNVEETMRQEQRQEDFFNQYQSIGAQTRQMKEAGLNPAMLQSGSVSPVSGPSATPAHASPGGDPVSAILNLITGIQQHRAVMKQSEAQLAKTQAETRKTTADAEGKEFENANAADLLALDKQEREARISEIFAGIDNKVADTALKEANTDLVHLQQDYQDFMNAIAEFNVENQQRILDATLAASQAQTAYIQSEKALNDLRKKYAEEDREDERKLLKAQLDIAEEEAAYAKKRKERHDEILDAEITAAKGNARHAKYSFGLDLTGKITSGLGILTGLGLGAWKLLRTSAKGVGPIMIDNPSLYNFGPPSISGGPNA